MFKIINLKFPQLNNIKESKSSKIFKSLKLPKLPKIPNKFHPPLYVLTFGLITSLVVLAITGLWYRSNPPVAYTTDNLIKETEGEVETEVVFVEPSSREETTAELVPPPNLAVNQTVEAQENEEQKEQTVAAQTAGEVTGAKTSGPDLTKMQHPIEGPIGPGFEFAFSEIYKDFRLHPGLDYSAQRGSEVVAALEGVVGSIEPSSEGGYIVTLKHEGGWETIYTALETELKVNQYVAQGAVLGRLVGLVPGEIDGGSHLHFELRKDGKAVDPSQYLK